MRYFAIDPFLLFNLILSSFFFTSAWKVCNWNFGKKKLKVALMKNKIAELEAKMESDPTINAMNMNRF
jgi:hypothetical protein